MEGVDQLLTDYQIKDGHIILQLNSVSSTSHQSPFPISIQNLQAKMLSFFSHNLLKPCNCQIPSDEFLCVRFRIFELFEVGFLSPATFTVYEYHRPGNQLYSQISSENYFAFITVSIASLLFWEAHVPPISLILPESTQCWVYNLFNKCWINDPTFDHWAFSANTK